MKYLVRRNERKKSNKQQIKTWNNKQTERRRESFNPDSHENNEFNEIFYDEAKLLFQFYAFTAETLEPTKLK